MKRKIVQIKLIIIDVYQVNRCYNLVTEHPELFHRVVITPLSYAGNNESGIMFMYR